MKKVIQQAEANNQLNAGRSVILVYGETELKISPKWKTVENAVSTIMFGEPPEKILVVL